MDMLEEDKTKFIQMIIGAEQAYKIEQFEADLNNLEKSDPVVFATGYFESFIEKGNYVISTR